MPLEPCSFGTINDPVGETTPDGLEAVPNYPPSKPSPGFGPVILNVIDRDDRVHQKNTRIFPFRCICYLEIKAADGTTWRGTGWLASPRTVITAGHCVYLHNHGGKVAQVKVVPGCNGPILFAPYGSCISRDVVCSARWEKDKDDCHDYGAIFLPQDCRFGEKLGHFGFSDLKNEELDGITVSISGYPTDKMLNTQWYHRQNISAVEYFVLYHKVDTFKGHSGAPLWKEQEGNRCVVGIHSSGATEDNRAIRLNDEIYRQVKEWGDAGKTGCPG